MSDEPRPRPLSVSEDSAIAIPLRNLLSLLGAVATAVWGYSELEGRITTLETRTQMIEEDVERMERGTRDAATGIDPWATDVEQTTRIDRPSLTSSASKSCICNLTRSVLHEPLPPLHV